MLDSTKPAKPGKINVKASQVQDADNNVYGRYEVTWDEPNDTTASPAAYYRVEILPATLRVLSHRMQIPISKRTSTSAAIPLWQIKRGRVTSSCV